MIHNIPATPAIICAAPHHDFYDYVVKNNQSILTHRKHCILQNELKNYNVIIDVDGHADYVKAPTFNHGRKKEIK
jgi:hypothetical protein